MVKIRQLPVSVAPENMVDIFVISVLFIYQYYCFLGNVKSICLNV